MQNKYKVAALPGGGFSGDWYLGIMKGSVSKSLGTSVIEQLTNNRSIKKIINMVNIRMINIGMKKFVVLCCFLIFCISFANAQVGIVNVDTTICQGQDVILSLSGIKITYETTQIDQFRIGYRDEGGFYRSIPTVIGQDYFFTVTGTLGFYSFQCEYDAFYKIVVSPPEPAGTFDMGIPDLRPNPDVYNPGHYYRIDFKATKTSTVFSFDDSYYKDNCGALDFTLYKRKTITDKRILWSTGDTTYYIKATPDQTTTYYATVNDGLTTFRDSVQVIVKPSYNLERMVFINKGQKYVFGQDTLTVFGTYKKTFSTVLGCDSTVTLMLKEKPTVSFTDTVVCLGGDVSLSLKGIDYTYETTQIDQFRIGYRDEGGFYRSIPTVIGQDYFFTVTGTLGFYSFQCEYDAFYKIVVSPPEPAGTFDMGIPNLRPNPDVYNPGHYYRIDFKATKTSTVFSFGDSYYKDNCGALDFNVFRRDAFTDQRFLWSTGDTTESITVSPTQTQMYYVTIKDGDYYLHDSVNVIVNPSYHLEREIRTNEETYVFGQDTLECPGTYNYNFTSTLGCDSMITLIIKLIPLISNSDTTICKGEKVVLALNEITVSYDTTKIDQFEMTFTEAFSHSLPTIIGQDYFFTVTGQMNFFSQIQCNDFDAFFYKASSPPAPFGTFSFSEPNLRPIPDVYNPSHYYKIDFTASKTQSIFSSSDSYYRDNCGQLDFAVYKRKTITDKRILWSTGDTTASLSVAPSQTTTYYVTVTDGSGVSRDSVTINVNPSYDEKRTVFITNSLNYVFGPDTLTAFGTYKNTFSTALGCDSTVTLTLKEKPSVSFADTIICQRENVLLSLKGVDYTYETYQIDQFVMTFSEAFSHSVRTLIGQEYFFTVTGQMNFFSQIQCNDFDAFFYKGSSPPAPFGTFSFSEPNLRPIPDVYNPSNYYKIDFTASKTQSIFSSSDSYYRDNCGHLDFTVYKRDAFTNQQFMWSTGDTTESINVSPAQTTTYFVTIKDGNYYLYDSVKVVVRPSYSLEKKIYTSEKTIVFRQDILENPGNYTYNLTTVLGCDSTIILLLRGSLQKTTIINDYDGFTECYNALDSIVVFGKDAKVVFQNGSNVSLIAGNSILFLPEFQAKSGSSVHAYITTDGAFCDRFQSGPIVQQMNEKSAEEISSAEEKPILTMRKTVKIYPNPNRGCFTLELTNFDYGANVHIFNMLGRNVYKVRSTNQKSYKINIPEITKGIYIVKVFSKNEQITTKMIVN